jgi:fructokinase
LSSHSIAVLGENLVDLLVAPDGSVNAVIGGGPLNVARTIGRLGGDVHFVSGISSDAFGTLIRNSLLESGVTLSLPKALVEPTTLAVVELNPEGPQYHFHLAGTAAFALEAEETSAALGSIAPVTAMYFGTLGLLVEPMASLGEALVMSAAADTLVVIDPNCRPSAVRNHDEYLARVARLCSRADVVKVSTEDLEYLYPDRAVLDGAVEMLHLGTRCVIVTDGGAPVRVLGADVHVTLDVAPTDVVDSVGAGDALVGGFLTWWTERRLTRDDLGDADTVAAAVAASVEISRITCQRAGAQPPRRDEVLELEGWHRP